MKTTSFTPIEALYALQISRGNMVLGDVNTAKAKREVVEVLLKAIDIINGKVSYEDIKSEVYDNEIVIINEYLTFMKRDDLIK